MDKKETFGRSAEIKARATTSEKVQLELLAKNAGLSLSRYLITVGLARQTGVSAERNSDLNRLLDNVLQRLIRISDQSGQGGAESLLVLNQLYQIERLILLLMPVPAFVDDPL